MNQDLVLDSSLQSAKNLAWWLYLGHAASLVFSLGAFSFIPVSYTHLTLPTICSV